MVVVVVVVVVVMVVVVFVGEELTVRTWRTWIRQQRSLSPLVSVANASLIRHRVSAGRQWWWWWWWRRRRRRRS